ncbi:MAG: type II toxin-antitoxin system VapC family toxin [Chloroflexota bacterium]|nr:type II toxin-antitoxin system VapC family toxin [Chloroflexota bacterium]
MSVTASIPDAAGGAASPLLLDTHAWLWWLNDSNDLPSSVRLQIQAAYDDARLWISAISAWELALLVQKGRVELRLPVREWIARAEALAGLRFLPVDNGIAVRSIELPDLHADPADRLIVASAERLGATLVTKDELLRAYSGVATLWS